MECYGRTSAVFFDSKGNGFTDIIMEIYQGLVKLARDLTRPKNPPNGGEK